MSPGHSPVFQRTLYSPVLSYSYAPLPIIVTHTHTHFTHFSDWTSDEGEEGSEFMCSANTAADILHLLSSMEGCEEVLTQLLQQKNLEGYTPFMAAVAYKVSNKKTTVRFTK